MQTHIIIFYTRQATMGTKNGDTPRYFIMQPENGGIWDLFKYGILGSKASGAKFFEASDGGTLHQEMSGGDNGSRETLLHRLMNVVSIVLTKVIGFFGKPLEWIGWVVEWILNLLLLNDGLLWLLIKVMTLGVVGKVVFPDTTSEDFISTIGHIDGRIDLYPGDAYSEAPGVVDPDARSRTLMDLCMMASKLSYENALLIKNVVNEYWKMNFIDFYDCWNDFQHEDSTQVFIFTDKPKDANLIMICFRGTEPFDPDDWITDFDYTWHNLPNTEYIIHTGFLEAMGLGNRENNNSFPQLLQLTKITEKEPEPTKFLPYMACKGAYVRVSRKLKCLLNEHKNAKFMVTGHSLGGALAILFPTVLVLNEEDQLLQRMIGVHTFGQPRIGNKELGEYVESKLQQPHPRYFRVVYCNDVVPRMPYNNTTFLYKHFGVLLYYNQFFVEQKMDQLPNPNDYDYTYLIPKHLNAVWELMRAMMMGMTYGPEYTETWEGIWMRIMGLVLPGVSAHGPSNYINSIRLGSKNRVEMCSCKR